MIDFPLLKKICEIPGAPGFERTIRQFVIDQIKDLVDEWRVDAMGNLISVKKGATDRRIMAAAHLDEISFIVKHIDEDGFIRFHTLGGFDPKTLTAQRVLIHGKETVVGVMGSKPIHIMKPEERKKAPQIDDYFIDTGMRYDAVVSLVEIGDSITRERSLIEMKDCVNGKSLDNRVSVYILIEALKQLRGKSIPYDFYAVFTVQEEVGLRGAMNAAHQINPHFGIGLDVTVAFDVPGAQPHEMITKLGKGAAIKIMDSSTICDRRMIQYMSQLAQKHNIKHQREVLTGGGTDTAGLQRYGQDGSIAGAISIPLRHIHQVIEMAHKQDVADCIKLLTVCVKEMDQFDWT